MILTQLTYYIKPTLSQVSHNDNQEMKNKLLFLFALAFSSFLIFLLCSFTCNKQKHSCKLIHSL